MNEIEKDWRRNRFLRFLEKYNLKIRELREAVEKGRVTIGKKRIGKPQVGTADPENGQITPSPIWDRNIERVIEIRDVVKGGRPSKVELKPIDLENLKIRLFCEEFAQDPVVVAYLQKPTLDNRFQLLIHISALQKEMTPSDLMDLYGLTDEFLFNKLKSLIDTKDKNVSARYLTLAFKLKYPEEKKVTKAVQNNYYFASKEEAMKKVKEQINAIGRLISNGNNAGGNDAGGAGEAVVGDRARAS